MKNLPVPRASHSHSKGLAGGPNAPAAPRARKEPPTTLQPPVRAVGGTAPLCELPKGWGGPALHPLPMDTHPKDWLPAGS